MTTTLAGGGEDRGQCATWCFVTAVHTVVAPQRRTLIIASGGS